MDPFLFGAIVTFAFFLAAAALGLGLENAGRPFGKVKLAFHLLLFLGVAASAISIIFAVGIQPDRIASTVYHFVFAAGAVVFLLTGIMMLAGKEREKGLVAVHKNCFLLMTVAQVAGIAFILLKI
jgi:hypothetical protein